jgi:signal transduction histidine kinase
MQPSPEDRFAATLAHQLKTPLAALDASAANLRRNIRCLFEELGTASTGTGTGEVTAFIARAVIEPAPAPFTGLMPQDRMEVMTLRLARAGVSGDHGEVSALLIRGGWDTYVDEIIPLLRADRRDVLDLLETTARLRANLGALDASIRHIGRLSSAIGMLARPPRRVPVDIRPGLEAVAGQIRAVLPPGVDLDVRLTPMRPVSAQPDLLDEVWSNLMTNAAQAIGGTGRIQVEGCYDADGGRVIVRVVDNGPGIPAGARTRIFEPFFTTRAAGGGTGLGLSLCQRIVDAHDGSISVESRPGRTVFEVSLPAAGGER